MKGKTQLVTLENGVLNVTQDFEINHAERLLRMPNNGGWQLPKDSQYKFDFDNGIGFRKNNDRNNGAKKASDDK